MWALVDEARGSHRAHPVKPVQICMRVADVGCWGGGLLHGILPVEA